MSSYLDSNPLSMLTKGLSTDGRGFQTLLTQGAPTLLSPGPTQPNASELITPLSSGNSGIPPSVIAQLASSARVLDAENP